MKILFNNEVLSATITAANADTSYPVVNLNDVFLKKIFKSTATSETITITFSADKVIDSIYIGFTNGSSISAGLYNSSNSLISTQAIDGTTKCATFTAVTGVRKIVITMSGGADKVYIGTICAGSAYSMPPFLPTIREPIDRSKEVWSDDGQLLKNKREWRKMLKTSHEVNRATYLEIYGLLSLNSRPVFIDVYENTKTGEYPFYGDVSISGTPTRSGDIYKITLLLTEAR
jgi:hypothetical protein